MSIEVKRQYKSGRVNVLDLNYVDECVWKNVKMMRRDKQNNEFIKLKFFALFKFNTLICNIFIHYIQSVGIYDGSITYIFKI